MVQVTHSRNAVAALTIAFLAACLDAPLPRTAAPTLVAPKRATSMQSTTIQMPLGETLAWRVSARGVLVGTAALDVRGQEGDLKIESRFRTIGLADEFHSVRHRLVTSLGSTASAPEDVHSALGRVRAWARAGASPATLSVLHEDTIYLLKLAQPRIDNSLSKPTLRIEAEVGTREEQIEMTLWITSDAKRLPLQMTFSQDGQTVQARLLGENES